MTANPAPLPAGDRQPTSALPEGEEAPHRHHAEANPQGKRLLILSLTALGVVYGDIGTSPLYAIKEAFKPAYGLALSTQNVYGLLSLIAWVLVLVVSVKYVAFILRADNRGEGGVLALLALILQRQHSPGHRRRRGVLIALGLFGGAFLYGDGMITPAISVVSAVEGLEVAAPGLSVFVIPITFLIIALLFAFQRHGTARVGGLFGWIMLAWFASIAVLGVRSIVTNPVILTALNPIHAVEFFLAHPWNSFIALGAVVLVVTGGEALYADMGHFGPKPIRIVWYYFVLPALLLNYFGQGALLLRSPEAIVNPFYLLAPSWFVFPLLFVATSAAIVASQALISGAFSLTQQAIQLGYSPRMRIIHTSSREAGQIYIPEVNKALAAGTLVLVVTFQTAERLGAAYGVAVSGTMAITSILFFIVVRDQWGWSKLKAGAFLTFFLTIDLAFFFANLAKVPHGGWVPLAAALSVFTLMTTWKRGRAILRAILQRGTVPIDMFLADVERRKPVRVKGTAVFMTSDPVGAPVVLLHHLKHNKVLHEQVILLSVVTAEVPEVPADERIEIESLGQGFFRVQASYGFMETPNVPAVLKFCGRNGINAKKTDVSYYLGRERLIPTLPRKSKDAEIGTMARWRKKLFVLMSQNARGATEFFGIPPNRVIELGTQIEF